MQDTDKDWKNLGDLEPYWAVITSEKFKQQNLTEESLSEFFQSGENHIDAIFEIIRQHLDSKFVADRICDFGCGVGRLMIPLTQKCKEVVGIDVSEAMLEECEKNLKNREISNYQLIHSSDDELNNLSGNFDLIHSFIVFQHIPIERGMKIIKHLLNYLRENGILVIQIKYYPYEIKTDSPENLLAFDKKVNKRDWLGFFKSLVKLILSEFKLYNLQGRINTSPSQSGLPIMQMNSYDLNDLLWLLQEKNLNQCYVRFSDHGLSEKGVIIFAQKNNSIKHPDHF